MGDFFYVSAVYFWSIFVTVVFVVDVDILIFSLSPPADFVNNVGLAQPCKFSGGYDYHATDPLRVSFRQFDCLTHADDWSV